MAVSNVRLSKLYVLFCRPPMPATIRHATQTIGPPPLALGRPSPWLHGTQVTPSSRRRVAAPAPPAHAATEASLSRARSAQRRFDGKAEIAQQPPGPCPERHLPLSRHTPRPLSRAEQKRPPSWRPDREWLVCAKAPSPSAAATAPVPLGGQISKRVVDQCYVAYADPAILRVTCGGWAATAAPPPPLNTPLLDARDPEWPLDEEITHWCSLSQRKGTLAIVNDFLNSSLATELLDGTDA